jgi:hypothetical protein
MKRLQFPVGIIVAAGEKAAHNFRIVANQKLSVREVGPMMTGAEVL